MSLSIEALRRRLSTCMNLDARRLSSRLHGVKKLPEGKQGAVLETIAADLDAAEARYQARLAGVPRVTYPDNLPVSQKQAEIAKAIEEHQVVIIAGETGSGKTTQIPKICLALGRGVKGFIGHTQPRRLAARTVAARIAEEMESELGHYVGYKVRFTDQVSEQTHIKLMTDGILLAEIQNDRMLTQYDTIIIDEAHERSLNIDFILGYLKQLLPKRMPRSDRWNPGSRSYNRWSGLYTLPWRTKCMVVVGICGLPAGLVMSVFHCPTFTGRPAMPRPRRRLPDEHRPAPARPSPTRYRPDSTRPTPARHPI